MYHATGTVPAPRIAPRLGYQRPAGSAPRDCDYYMDLATTTSDPGRLFREQQRRIDAGWLTAVPTRIGVCPQARLDEVRSAWRVDCFEQFAQEEMGDPQCEGLVNEWETEINPLTRLAAEAVAQEASEPLPPETSNKMNALYIVGGVVAVGVVGWFVFK